MGEKVTTDCWDLNKTQADSKDSLSDTTSVISKFVRVKLRKSPANINYSRLPPGWTKLFNIHQEGGKFKIFFSVEWFNTPDFQRGTLGGGNSQGWIKLGSWDRVFFASVSVKPLWSFKYYSNIPIWNHILIFQLVYVYWAVQIRHARWLLIFCQK